MTAVYASVAAGQPQLLLITGEAGIGKTRLIEDLVQQVRSAERAAHVRIGESAPLAGAALAYGPFVAALGERAAWLLASDESGDMFAARHRLFERVLTLLGDLAAEAPLVLVLEDLHWADESSHELLAFLAVRLRDLPVLVVATLRDEELADEARRWLSDLERRPRVTRLRLAGLAPHEVAELVTDQVPEGSGPDPVAAVVRAAEGNPLYALELAGSGARVPPASITEAVLAKAAGVAPSARAVVDQVCVADGGMSHELLAATVPLGEDDLLAAAREAVSRRLLAATADGYAFPHDLIRQVFYGQLLPGERRRLHRRVADALAAQPEPDPALLALHWQLADCPDRAAPAALLAARQAVTSRAYPEADRFYTLAVGQLRWLPEPGPGLLEEAAQAASWAGHPGRAARYMADALAQPAAAGTQDRARMLERLGRYHWEAGDPRAAVDATRQAWDLLEAEPASALQARILAALANCRMLLGEPDEAMPLATQAVELAEKIGADVEYAHGLAILGIVQAQRGELEAGLAALHTSFTLACRSGSIEGVVRAAANQMYLLYTAGRSAEALEVARSGRRAARSLGAPAALTSVLDNNTAAVLTATGRWAEADQLLAELIGESRANVTRYLQLLQLELAVGRGERDSAEELAATLRKSPEDPRLLGPLHACLAEQALNAGDLATAADEVLQGLAALKGAALAEEEIRLLAAGARVSADLAALPGAARPGKSRPAGKRRRPAWPAGPGPSPASRAAGSRKWLPSGRWPPRRALASMATTTGRPGGPWPGPGRRLASPTGRPTPACARPEPRSGQAGVSRPPGPWRPVRASRASFRHRPCSAWPVNWPGGRDWAARPPRLPLPPRPVPGSTSPAAKRTSWPSWSGGTATGRSRAPFSSATGLSRCTCPAFLTNWASVTVLKRRRWGRIWA